MAGYVIIRNRCYLHHKSIIPIQQQAVPDYSYTFSYRVIDISQYPEFGSRVKFNDKLTEVYMFGEHHSLINDFPELKDKIHELKTCNPRFAELFEQYHDLDREIYRIEEQIETPSDQYTEDLKKKRVLLKDQLYAMLTSTES